MARLLVKLIREPGDEKGVILMQGNKALEMKDGDSQEFLIGAEGINFNVKAVTERGVPLGNQVSPAATPGMSRTDPRQQAAVAPGGQSGVDGSVPGPVAEPKTPAPTEALVNAGAVNPDTTTEFVTTGPTTGKTVPPEPKKPVLVTPPTQPVEPRPTP